MDLDKLNTGAKICNSVLNQLIEYTCANKIANLKDISLKGDTFLMEHLGKVYKNSKSKYIGFPTCMSINNCVENYNYSNELVTLDNFDSCIVKFKLGTNIDGCISLLEKTFKFSKDIWMFSEKPDISDLEEKCKKICEKNMFNGNTNDELKKLLEVELLSKGFQAVENCVSYQTFENHINTSESKYIILNYQKYFDDDDNVILPNTCFEFLNGEVYHVTIRFVSNEEEKMCLTKSLGNSHLYRLNEYYYSLKSKSGKNFYSKIKSNHSTNPFNYTNYTNESSNKIGFKECFENGILDELEILYTEKGVDVYGFTFTVVISNKKGIIVK